MATKKTKDYLYSFGNSDSSKTNNIDTGKTKLQDSGTGVNHTTASSGSPLKNGFSTGGITGVSPEEVKKAGGGPWQGSKETSGSGSSGSSGTGSGGSTPYSGLPGVSETTASKTGEYQQGYKPSDTVTQAQQQLQTILDQKPQSYESKYGEQLEGILQKILNPEKFKYSFNEDELFRSYADEYTQRGKQASLDAMGQAAGLTGGYGNSYAQQVGNQQYQQYLLGLYDKGLDLYDRAYQRYKDEQAGLLDQFGVLAQQDNTDYGRYRDTVGDWTNERDFWNGQYNTEADRDYSRYNTELQYWTGLAQVENQDYRNDQDRQEAIRQYNEQFAENQRQFDETQRMNKESEDKKYAYEYAMAMIKNGKVPSSDLLKILGLTKKDVKKMIQEQKSGGGSGGSGGSGGGETYYRGPDGKYYKKNKDGTLTQVKYDDIPKNAYIDTQTIPKARDKVMETMKKFY